MLFFSPAARANNTTLWAALAHGPVITNLDADSPPELVHDETVFDIDRLDQWPAVSDLSRVGLAGRAVCQQYSWSALAGISDDSDWASADWLQSPLFRHRGTWAQPPGAAFDRQPGYPADAAWRAYIATRGRFFIGSSPWHVGDGSWPLVPVLDRQLLATVGGMPQVIYLGN